MALSLLYKNLKKRIAVLKKEFCNFDSIDVAVPKNQDKLRAFKVLVHAEIESYFESSVQNVLDSCNTEWINNQKIITPLVFLILFSNSKFEANEKQLTKNDRVNQILQSFKTTIDSNHGIREKNILKLVVPIGVDSNIDTTWLSTMDSYGQSRGRVAHKSSSVQKQLDKKDELSDIYLLLKGIKIMDIKIQKASSNRLRPY